jgi:site-specific DNA-methyltransferase (cytosine-N4-specific)
MVNLRIGDCRDGMREFLRQGMRVQTCVTSPPYWGLRDYGVAGQLGLEPTIAEYVQNMVDVFRLVRDLLADDGTLWLNLGDSYGQNQGAGFDTNHDGGARKAAAASPKLAHPTKPKDLCGIPWRIAFALQADGWYLRSDIIWAKPNPMPESVTDRPTKAHEYLFLLSKQERYYYDAAAIAEPVVNDEVTQRSKNKARNEQRGKGDQEGIYHARGEAAPFSNWKETRNRRSVWTIATEPFPDAHFATFPQALVEPCILAGSRVGDTVFDPFMGSGTVAQVAQDLGRRWAGCELSPEYAKMIAKRTRQQAFQLEAAD